MFSAFPEFPKIVDVDVRKVKFNDLDIGYDYNHLMFQWLAIDLDVINSGIKPVPTTLLGI